MSITNLAVNMCLLLQLNTLARSHSYNPLWAQLGSAFILAYYLQRCIKLYFYSVYHPFVVCFAIVH